jgi:hypothetical protein
MAADLVAEGSLGEEMDRVSQAVTRVRDLALEMTYQAHVAEKVYIGQFLQDLALARSLALDIGSGRPDSVAFNAQSLAEHGDDPKAITEYLSEFEVQDPSREYPFPKIGFPTTAVINYNGVEHHIDDSPFSSRILTPYNFSPSYNPSVELPTLVDPKPRSFADLAELEALDHGHAQQVMEAYRMVAREQKQKDPRATFQDPLIVRMVAILPTGYDYMTDFVPRVEIPKGIRSWDPYLLFGGALNPSGNFLRNDGLFNRNKVVLNSSGRESALRVIRPLPGQVAEEQSSSLMPLVDHEMNSMAVILFPYEIQKPRISKPDSSYIGDAGLDGMYGGGVYRGGATKGGGGDVGGAMVGAGASGWASADKRPRDSFGDRFVPAKDGRPLIFSVRLLTAQRDADSVAPEVTPIS